MPKSKLTMVCSSPSPPERLALSPGIPGEEVADSVVDPELELPASSFLLSGLKVINYINFGPIQTYTLDPKGQIKP